MKKIAKIAVAAAAGVVVGCAVGWAIVHRRVIVAAVTGAPMPEPPAWHAGHPCLKTQA